MLLQNLALKPGALRPRANCSSSLYLSFLISKMGLRIPCLSRTVGELSKQCKALSRKSASYFFRLVVLFMFLSQGISTSAER